MADAVVSKVSVQVVLDRDDGAKVEKTFDSMEKAVKSMDSSLARNRTNITRTIGKITALGLSIRGLSKFIGGGIKDSEKLANSTYILDRVLQGGASSAKAYAQEVENLMGIPMADFLGTQSTFATMLSGYGIAAGQVDIMSKSLTQLSYDLAAWNTHGFDQAQILRMLQTGLSGYDRALKQIGWATDNATLRQTALNHGLDINVSKLTRAAKAQLTYLTYLDNAAKSGVFGALAKRVDMPSVAFGILKNQIRLVAQTLASVLVPVIMKVMPYLVALTRAINNVIVKIASFFGIDIKPLNFGLDTSISQAVDFGDGLGGIGDAATGAAKKVKQLKNQLGGFDDLNVMKQETPSSPAGGGAGDLGMIGDLGIEMPEYGDFLGDMMGDVEKLVPGLETVLWLIGGIMAAIAGIKIIGKISTLVTWITSLATAIQGAGGVTAFLSAKFPLLAKAIGVLSGPVGIVIGVIIAVGIALVQFWQKSEDFRNRVSDTFNKVGEIFTSLWENSLKPFFDTLVLWFGFVWTNGIKPLWDRFVDFVGAIATLVLAILDPFLSIVGVIVDYVMPVVSSFFGVGVALASALVTAVLNLAEGVIWAATKVVDIVTWVIDAIVDGFKWVLSNLDLIWNTITDVVGAAVGAVIDAIASMVTWVIDKFNAMKTAVVNVATAVWTVVIDKFNAMKTAVIDAIKSMVTWIIDKFNAMKTAVMEVVTAIWDWVSNAFTKGKDKVVGIVDTLVTAVKDTFSTVLNSVYTVVNNIWNKIVGLFSKGGQVFSGVVGSIKNVFVDIVNTLIRGINNVISIPFNAINSALRRIKDISILGAKPFGWIPNIGIPKIPSIPKYEKGTNFVPETGLALLHEGEQVIPKKVAQGKEYQNQQSYNDQSVVVAIMREMLEILRMLLDKDVSVTLSAFEVNEATSRLRLLQSKLEGA